MGKIAFIFAGQGAQHPGMANGISDDIIDRLDAVRPGTRRQLKEAPAEELVKTDVTQPCIYAADLAAAFALKEKGIEPAAVAGYSLGELAALAFAGAFSIEEGMKLVSARGAAMQKCSDAHETGMGAVLKLSEEKVVELTDKYDQVFPVNFNCPGQISVAGDKEQLTQLSPEIKAAGGLMRILSVAGGFHSPFMADAKEELKELFTAADIQEAQIPVYSNYTSKPYEGNYSELMLNQIVNPVLWQRSIENMIEAGIDTFIEVGPGTQLTKMLTRISKEITVLNVEDAETLEKALEKMEA